MTSSPDPFELSCPAPLASHDTVQMAHGGGGRTMRRLIEDLLLPTFGTATAQHDPSAAPHDSAVLELAGQRVAFTTDSFVISPLFFPGGDIGKLAVCGTVNDLAMSGAVPQYLSCGLILEEGFPLASLRQVVQSMRAVADAAGVQVVTGDTKVVDRGKADGMFINTAGIGIVPAGIEIHPSRIAPGDRVVVSGDLGRHGIAIMSLRESLQFDGSPPSDCGPLSDLVHQLTSRLGRHVHCLRDLTRGGLAAALIELADHAQVGIDLQESSVPVHDAVRGACELLGLDPLYVANEGRLVAIVAEEAAEQTHAIMQAHVGAETPAVIGTVTESHRGNVELLSGFGSGRWLDLPAGEQMPRIC